MAERSGLSKSSIGRIWKAFEIKPHRAGVSCQVCKPRVHQDRPV
jgi:hypothetical protein